MRQICALFLGLSLCFSIFSCRSVQKTEKEISYNAPDSLPIGLKVGNVAPDLKYMNPKDSIIALSSLRGYYVLLDFWASWCGPCRGENPNVVRAYQHFSTKKFIHGKGFKIYNVSLDMNKEKWIRAIETDHLNWPYHVSDLKGWSSEAAGKYQINSIPANVLIDPWGVIVAKNLRGPALDEKLQSLLAPDTKAH